MIVMKFGGSSLASAERIAQAAGLVGQYLTSKPIPVVSAMGGVTDSLIGIARLAMGGRKVLPSVDEHLSALEMRHETALHELCPVEIPPGIAAQIAEVFVELREICMGIALLGELSARSLDAVSSFGEKLSAPLMAAALQARGLASVAISAEELLLTDNTFGHAHPLFPASRVRTRARLEPLLADGIIPVLTGFIGATEDGITTTLGRNGSDYSASIFGSLLNADEVWIWTDVDGILSADPRAVPGAQNLPRLSYAEAAELAYFGSKVLHPAAILPVVEASIPLRIKNTFKPEHEGTVLVSEAAPEPHAVKAVTSIRNLALLTVQGAGLSGFIGAAARVFGAVAKAGVNVLMISQASSESNICFVITRDDVPRAEGALRADLAEQLTTHEVDAVITRGPVAIVTIVGAGMAGTPGVAGRLFSSLGRSRINVMAIAQGSNEYSISCVVDDAQAAEAVSVVHHEFVESDAERMSTS